MMRVACEYSFTTREQAEGAAKHRSLTERNDMGNRVVAYVVETSRGWQALRECELPEDRGSYYLLGAYEKGQAYP